MNHTSNYQLPQWEESDRILRTDFNGAMNKIEEGLTGLEGQAPAVKLREFTVSQAAESVSLDLSGLDLAAYPALRLRAESGGAVNAAVGLRVNGLESDYEYRSPSSLNPITDSMITLGSYGESSVTVELRPFGGWLAYYTDGLSYSGSRVSGVWNRGIHRQASYGQITSLQLVCLGDEGEQVAAGTKVVLYGLRE